MSASYVALRTPHSRWIIPSPRAHAGRSKGSRCEAARDATTEAYSLYVARRRDRANDADGPFSSASDPLDGRLAEDPIRPDHQRDDHQQVGGEVLGPAAHPGIDIA